MSPYQTLSIIQFFFILICGISVLDFGVELNDNGLGFNDLVEDLLDGAFWGLFQFWGYCMIIVAILQLLKALSVENL